MAHAGFTQKGPGTRKATTELANPMGCTRQDFLGRSKDAWPFLRTATPSGAGNCACFRRAHGSMSTPFRPAFWVSRKLAAPAGLPIRAAVRPRPGDVSQDSQRF